MATPVYIHVASVSMRVVTLRLVFVSRVVYQAMIPRMSSVKHVSKYNDNERRLNHRCLNS